MNMVVEIAVSEGLQYDCLGTADNLNEQSKRVWKNAASVSPLERRFHISEEMAGVFEFSSRKMEFNSVAVSQIDLTLVLIRD